MSVCGGNSGTVDFTLSHRVALQAPTSKGGGDVRMRASMLGPGIKKTKKQHTMLQLLGKQPQSRSDFDPPHVNTALGLTSAALERAGEAPPKCLSTARPLNRRWKRLLCDITCLKMSSVTSAPPGAFLTDLLLARKLSRLAPGRGRGRGSRRLDPALQCAAR